MLPQSLRGTALRCDAGFVLIEQLVVIAVVATTLAAIGSLIGSSSRGAYQIERRVSLIQTANNLFFTAMSSRDGLINPQLSGAEWNHRWRMTMVPVAAEMALPANDRWMPVRMELLVQSPSGGQMRLQTIRLQRTFGQ